jgi:hypothetical protein
MKKNMIILLLLPSFAMATPVVFKTALSSSKEVQLSQPAVAKKASGVGSFVFEPMTRQLSFTIDYKGLSGEPSMAHFHHGVVGSNGPVLQTICGQPAPTLSGACPHLRSGDLRGAWTLNAEQVKDLMQGDMFINIHTSANPGGELRGQLLSH